MPSAIPDARYILQQIDKLECPCRCEQTIKQFELVKSWTDLALGKMKRDPAESIAPTKHPPVTKEQAEEILRLHRLDPTLHQQQIAVLVGTNAGRVSEVINGLRKGV